MSLRDYQTRLVVQAREASISKFKVNKLLPDGNIESITKPVHSVLLQLPTGGGKTPIVAEITRSAFSGHRRVWFVAPRNELVGQASAHFSKWKIPHGIISARSEESRAYQVHVVSKDTLLRRMDRIKNWPDILIFDECHIAMDAQIRIITAGNAARLFLGLPVMLVLGMTATPERQDGRGLWSGAGGPYDTICYGPSIPWLTSGNFLSPLRYFAPPIEGLDKLHRKGTEVDENELEALLEKRKVYGDVIGYYEKFGTVKHTGISLPGQPVVNLNQSYAKGRPALIFCRSVKSAYETAERFCKAGFSFHCIEGNMPDHERKALIDGLRDGKIDGLTNCDIATYGLDIPRIEYGASIRPTASRALYFQMVGRILRPFTGKAEALFFDHANLVQEHQTVENPGVPLFYLEDIDWNFYGVEKRKRKKPQAENMKQCPLLDFEWCGKPSCAGCSLKDPEAPDPRRLGLEVVDAKLEERKGPIHISDLQPEEKRDIQDRIGRAAEAAFAEDGQIQSGPVAELLKVAHELNRSPMWVYHYLTDIENKRRNEAGKGPRLTVNSPLLHEIARIEGFKPEWAWYRQKELQKRRKEEAVV
jgi:DNA repair protein RadD